MSSTKLTDCAGGAPTMADSRALDLVLALARAHDALLAQVSRALERRGYAGASPSVLAFLGQLDCGVNVAAEVARRLGQSRQMVAKTVKRLSELGYLRMSRDPQRGNQKVITFTATGEQLIADARAILAELDATLEGALGQRSLAELIAMLGRVESAAG